MQAVQPQQARRAQMFALQHRGFDIVDRAARKAQPRHRDRRRFRPACHADDRDIGARGQGQLLRQVARDHGALRPGIDNEVPRPLAIDMDGDRHPRIERGASADDGGRNVGVKRRDVLRGQWHPGCRQPDRQSREAHGAQPCAVPSHVRILSAYLMVLL